MRATFDTRRPSGQVSQGSAVEAGGWIDFDSVRKEVEYGGLRPDLLAITGGRLLMVEIAVTHFVAPEKIDQIEALGVAALKIDLASMERDPWGWDVLRELVVDGIHNKAWIRPLDYEQLRDKAKAQAEKPFSVEQSRRLPGEGSGKPPRIRYHVGRRIVDLIEYPFGIAIWCPYDPDLNDRIKGLSREMCGSWRPTYKRWLFPVEAKQALEQRLGEWADGPPQRKS